MTYRIFLSHNHADKQIVENVALRLAEIFSQEEIFYDSWSIAPGDGIIDRMNEGLAAPELVLFFVSRNSLKSAMVKMEWQNALFAASKGKTRIVPVRIDNSELPPILRQTLYIDMHNIGFTAALTQIINVTQGNATFTPSFTEFSNLTLNFYTIDDTTTGLEIAASHLLEPNPSFAIFTSSDESELEVSLVEGGMFKGGWQKNIAIDPEGTRLNAFIVKVMGNMLSPGFPVKICLKRKIVPMLYIESVRHEVQKNVWKPIPLREK